MQYARSITAAFLVVSMCGVGFPAAATETNEEPALIRWIAEVEACFHSRIAHLAQTDRTLPRAPTGFTRMYVFEQIAKELQARSGENQSRTISQPVESFCTENLVKPYLSAFSKSLDKARRQIDNQLAPLGTGHIESSSIFVELTHNKIGSHNKGHYDITLDAIDKSGIEFTDDAKSVLASASQLPDLFRWSHGIHHAHTEEYLENDASDRSQKIDRSKHEFRQLLVRYIDVVIKHVNARDYAGALVVIGVAAHMVQDLCYHRGMTLRQHSGLAYVLNKNPDFPAGALAKIRWNESLTSTMLILRTVRVRVSVGGWNELVTWTAPKGFNFEKVARQIFPSGEDIGVRALFEYYTLSQAYLTGSRNPAELREESCDAETGLACWSPALVLAGILND